MAYLRVDQTLVAEYLRESYYRCFLLYALFTDVVFFAGDTNCDGIDGAKEQIKSDHNIVSSWLSASKLVLNLNETLRMQFPGLIIFPSH